jgi:aryl-alcohol dehydrogenase-like predicted oxidoreductase
VSSVGLYRSAFLRPETPQEETLEAFGDLVRSGKVGAVGASNFSGEQLAEALELSELERLPRYEWVQNGFSLLDQDDRESVFPVCREHGLGYTPFSPLAGGWLTGKYRRGETLPAGSRMTLRPEPYVGYVRPRLDALEERREAGERGVSMAALALAWALAQPELTAVVIGPNNAGHLEPAFEALELDLSPADRDHLTEVFS